MVYLIISIIILLAVGCIVSIIFNNNSLYVFIYLHKDWVLWHKIWENIDTFTPSAPSIFTSPLFPGKYIRLFDYNSAAFFSEEPNDCILCGFYESYSKKCYDYLNNKYPHS